jgi:hypothetical protein
MTHRSIIKALIILVITIVVAWSVANIADYARRFHDTPMVWSLGVALGLSNALAVYAFVIARTPAVRKPAVVGIVVFGGMSAVLQTALYFVDGANLVAAFAFGCFGPAAEGLLSWLHAALSEEPQTARKTAPAQRDTQRTQPAAGTQRPPQEPQEPAAQPAVAPAAPAPSERARTAYAMAQAQRPQKEIAAELGVSLRTVQTDLAEVRRAMLHTNGQGVHA